MKKVSIIIPIYNEEKNIANTIESILNMNYEDYELILVDDGSTDQSAEICKAYVERETTIVLLQPGRGGVSNARNVGIEYASGEYIWFVDADDSICYNSLDILISIMETSKAQLGVGHYEFYQDNSFFQSNRAGIYSIDQYVTEMLDSSGYFHSVLWNKLFRASIIKDNNIKFQKGVSWAEDCLFNQNYLMYVDSVAYTTETVYRYGFGIEEDETRNWHPRSDVQQEKIFDTMKQLFEHNQLLAMKCSLGEIGLLKVYSAFWNQVQNLLKELILINAFGYNRVIKKIWNDESFVRCVKEMKVEGKLAIIAKFSMKLHIPMLYRLFVLMNGK